MSADDIRIICNAVLEYLNEKLLNIPATVNRNYHPNDYPTAYTLTLSYADGFNIIISFWDRGCKLANMPVVEYANPEMLPALHQQCLKWVESCKMIKNFNKRQLKCL
jgi:hypothetical protein